MIIIILLSLVASACGVPGNTGQERPPTEIGLFEDSGGKMDIEQAAAARLAGRYKIESGNRKSLGFCRSALWISISLDQAPPEGPWILEVAAPWLEWVNFYLPTADGGWTDFATGLKQPSSDNCGNSFVLTVPANTTRDGYAYLRIKSVLSLNAELSIWPKDDYNRHLIRTTYLYGGLYGVMGAMVLINLLVFITTRDRTYLLYVLYLISIIIHQFCLQGQTLGFPKAFWPLVPSISLIISGSTLFFGAAFCRSFLNAKHFAPVFNRLIVGFQGASVLIVILTLTGHLFWGTWLTHSLAVLGPVLGLLAGFQALRRGFRPARYYLVAWFILLLGGMAWGVWSMGWQLMVSLPQQTITVAAALESILLTLALADRIGMIEREHRMLAQREKRFRQMSITDDLTGLYNARFFWSKLKSEVSHALALGQPLGLVLLDVDDFKRYNDTYGHTEGDKVLAELGMILRKAVRPSDSPCRYGGEEFALVLPGSLAQTTYEVAERVRHGLEKHPFEPQDGGNITVTTSLGTAQLLPGDDAKSLVKRADRALYEAKSNGKNRTKSDRKNEQALTV